MPPRTIHADSTEYLYVSVTTDHDITGDDIEMSFNDGDTWHTAEQVAGGARLLVGPGASPAIPLPSGLVTVLVRIHDTDETPVIPAGSIAVIA